MQSSNNVGRFLREMRLSQAEQVEEAKQIVASAQREACDRVRQLAKNVEADEAERCKRAFWVQNEMFARYRQSCVSDDAGARPEIQKFLQRIGDIMNHVLAEGHSDSESVFLFSDSCSWNVLNQAECVPILLERNDDTAAGSATA